MVVKLLIKKNNQWSGVYLYKGCFKGIGPYWTKSGKVYTGLTKEDAARLEKEMGYDEGTLSPSSKFWDMFFLKIDGSRKTKKADPMGEGIPYIEIDTNTPYGELQYLHALGHKRVAVGKSDLKPGTEYILINEDEEARKSNIESKKRREALREFEKMTIDDMRKALRLFGKNSREMSSEVIEDTMSNIAEKMPEQFLSKWTHNKNRELQFIIEEGVSKNVIRKSRSVYYYGTDIIGNSLQDAIANLSDKNMSDLRATIEEEIKSK